MSRGMQPGEMSRRGQHLGGVLVLYLAISTPLFAGPLTVSSDGPITSIAKAIAMAKPGAVIEVHGGIYRENVLLDRSIQLVGIGRPVIQGTGQASVVTITADRCVVRGFVIEHSGGMLVNEDSGILVKSSDNRIENNELRDVLFGIYLLHADRNEIVGNTIVGRSYLDIGDRGSGIHIWNSSYIMLERNLISEARDGVYLQNAYHSQVRENRVHHLRYGLHYMFSDDNDLEGNEFSDDVAGAAIMYSKRIRLRRNAFLHNRGFASYGVLFQSDQNCRIEDNIIADNAVGIFMEALLDSEVTGNLVAGNDVAFKVFSSATGNRFEKNNIVENLSPLELVGRQTENAWNGPVSGNYWSDYEGFDLDGDGVGDLPYRIQNIFEHMEAEMPLLRLYLFSPAAQSLAMAERGFPLFQEQHEADKHPLMKPVAIASMRSHVRVRPAISLLSIIVPTLLLVFAMTVFRMGTRP